MDNDSCGSSWKRRISSDCNEYNKCYRSITNVGWTIEAYMAFCRSLWRGENEVAGCIQRGNTDDSVDDLRRLAALVFLSRLYQMTVHLSTTTMTSFWMLFLILVDSAVPLVQSAEAGKSVPRKIQRYCRFSVEKSGPPIQIVFTARYNKSVRSSVCNVDVPWPYKLGLFQGNYTIN